MKVLAIILLFCVNNLYSQEIFAHQKARHEFNKSLISSNDMNRVRKKSFEKGYEYEAKFLGSFKTKKGEKFYIINSTYVNLRNLSNDNYIFVYNKKKQFIGYYIVPGFQLPTKLSNNELFFKQEDCINKISLINGIKKWICLTCKNGKDCIEFQN
ncbi:hypothetical protein GCM10022217_01420 [Chryseobacterium ginsenosidimutans]|uniref:hypothetical protein n=1 Tax=Chryseobacterium ginsenosidimutans TaxID=687846 RepID=UPI0031D3E7F3